mmetsp:Transcript_92911/g.277250  ORF Transcript_92911/g.277250 Transcript_92911/m.277250 type:complete len:609 (-) Transcript_92911:60-1886(-)
MASAAAQADTWLEKLRPTLGPLTRGQVYDAKEAAQRLRACGVKQVSALEKLRDAVQVLVDTGLSELAEGCDLEALDEALVRAHGERVAAEHAGVAVARVWAHGPLTEDSHEFWFLPRKVLLEWEAGTPLPRAQELYDRGLLERQSMELGSVLSGALRESHVVVSHRWESQHHPDPRAVKLREIQEILRRRPLVKHVWLDWSCAPQHYGGPPKTDAEEEYFRQTLKMVNLLYLGCTVLVLFDNQYGGRFWPCIEVWMGQQRVTGSGIEPEDEERIRLRVVCLGSTVGTEAASLAALQETWGKQPVDAVLARLKHPDVLVTNRKDKDVQLGRLEKLSRQFAECSTQSQSAGARHCVWLQAVWMASDNPSSLAGSDHTRQRDFMLAVLRRTRLKAGAMSMVEAELRDDLDFVAEAAWIHPVTLTRVSSVSSEALSRAAKSPALKDSSKHVRLSAMLALAQLSNDFALSASGPDDVGVITAARAALADSSSAVREVAVKICERTMGRARALTESLAHRPDHIVIRSNPVLADQLFDTESETEGPPLGEGLERELGCLSGLSKAVWSLCRPRAAAQVRRPGPQRRGRPAPRLPVRARKLERLRLSANPAPPPH